MISHNLHLSPCSPVSLLPPDGPSFRVAPADVYAELGENATLRCLVDSSPDPTIGEDMGMLGELGERGSCGSSMKKAICDKSDCV